MAAPEAAVMAPGAATPNREAMYNFLKGGITVMEKPETRDLLKDQAKVPDPGKTLIDLQRKEWDALGVDRDIGCSFLDKIDPGDAELTQLRQQFVACAMRTYLQSLEDRKPKKLETKKSLPKAVVLKFFDACNTKMDLPETRLLLYNYYKEHQQVPNQLIIDMQRDMLEVFGWEREHGCRMLSKLGEDHPNDQELQQKFMYWQQKAEQICMLCIQHAGAKPRGAELMEMVEQSLNETPEMQEMAKKAREEIEDMTAEEQEALVEKMQKKLQTVMKLPEAAREQYMNKLADDDKLMIVKSKVLMLDVYQKRLKEEQEEQAAAGAAGEAAAAPSGTPQALAPSSAAPSQMTM